MKKILILFATLTSLAACTKEGIAPNAKKALCRQPWQCEELSKNGQLISTSALNDLQMTFDDGGTYTDKDMASGSVDAGVWEFNSDETKIIFDKGTSEEVVWEIIDLNREKFRIKEYDDTDVYDALFYPIE